jgi:cell division septum initiation protein DivIVA
LNDSWTEGRVRELHRQMLPDAERLRSSPGAARPEPPQQTDLRAGDDLQRQALQMLALAQRTAEEHVASAHSEADRIHAEARAAAEQIIREAQARADTVRGEARQSLSDAKAASARTAEDARAHADRARHEGDKIVANARAQAAEIDKDAQATADRLKRQAQLRYEEMVGNLEAKREALQEQIKALQEFDRNYRARLLTFMQAQLRALWVDDSPADAHTEQPDVQPDGRPDVQSDVQWATPHLQEPQPESEDTDGFPAPTRMSDHD